MLNLTIRRDIEVIQILKGDELLYTICEPMGPGLGHMGIFKGNGMDDNGEEDAPLKVIYCSPVCDAEKEAIKEAIGMALVGVDI